MNPLPSPFARRAALFLLLFMFPITLALAQDDGPPSDPGIGNGGGVGGGGVATILTDTNAYDLATLPNQTLYLGSPNSGVLSGSVSTAFVQTGSIVGTGQVVLNFRGDALLDLAGSNSFTGPIYISACLGADGNFGGDSNQLILSGGTLLLGSSPAGGVVAPPNVNAAPANPVTIGSSGGTASVDATDTLTLTGLVSGTGAWSKAGPGLLVLSNTANAYTGPFTLASGTVRTDATGALSAGAAHVVDASLDLNGFDQTIGSLSGSGTISLGSAALTVAQSADATFSGVISGTGSLIKSGPATLTLSGANTYAGSTTVSAGTLTLGNVSALGTSGSVSVASGGTLDLAGYAQTFSTLAGSGTVTLGGAALTLAATGDATVSVSITGNGSLTTTGSATLALTSDNPFTGGTTITAGTLQLGNGGTSGFVAGDIANAGTLVIDRSDAVTFVNAISGTGSLTQAGTGTTILAGTNTYSGGTTIAAGTLQLGNGGTSGSIAGSVSVATGATLVYNRSDDFSSTLNVSGAGGLTKLGSGNLTVTGANTYTGPTQIVAGTFTPGAGSFPNGMGAVDVGASGTLVGSGLVVVGLTGAGTVNVSGATNFFVDNTGTNTFSGTIGGLGALVKRQAGTLVLTGPNTYAGGTTVSAGVLQLGNGGTSGSLVGDVALGSGAALAFNRTDSVTFSGSVSGAGALTQSGAGTLVLTGASTHSGGTTIGSGTLQLGAGGTSGSLTGDITDNAALIFNRSDAWSVASNLSGTGTVAKAGAGTLTLSGTDTYSGGTTVTAGALQIDTNARLGTGALTLDGGGIRYSAAFDDLRAVTLGAGGGALDTNGSNVAMASMISGSGAFTKFGAGTLVLSGTNTYAGGTTVTAGALQIDANAQLGAGALTLNGGGLRYGAAFDDLRAVTLGAGGGALDTNGNSVALASIISGSGGLTKAGAGTLTVTGTSTYAGGTIIAAGTLQLGNGGTSGSLTGDIANNAALFFNRSDAVTFSGNISGTGSLATTGGNALALSGDLTYSGLTTIGGGSLTVGNTHNFTLPGAISGSGGLTKAGTGTLTLSGNNTYTGSTTVSTGTLALGHANGAGTTGAVTINAGATFDTSAFGFDLGRLAGAGTATGSGVFYYSDAGDRSVATRLSGGANIAKSGAGTLTLSGNNAFTGGTSISDGTLVLGQANGLGTSGMVTVGSVATLDTAAFGFDLGRLAGGGTVTGAGTFRYSNAADQSVAAGLTGPAGLAKFGNGTLTLSGANTYTGPTTLSAGTLRAGGTDAFGSSIVTVNAGTLDLNGLAIGNALDVRGGGLTGLAGYTGTQTVSAGMSYNGTIGGSLVITSGGGVNTTGATFTGAITVQTGGALSGSGFVSGPATIASGGHLAPGNSPGTLTFTEGLTLEPGSILDFQLGTTSDLIAVTGGMLTGPGVPGGITLNLSDAGGFAAGTTYTLFNFVDGDTSEFATTDFSLGTLIPGTLGAGYAFGLTSTSLTLTYNDSVSAIPEPSSYAVIVGAAVLGLAAWRRRAVRH